MVELLILIAGALFVVVVAVSRTVLVSHVLKVPVKSSRVWLASAVSLIGILATALVIAILTGGTIVMALAQEISDPRSPLTVVILILYLAVSTVPGYLIERRILVRGGVSVDTGTRIARYSTVLLFLLIVVSSCVLSCSIKLH